MTPILLDALKSVLDGLTPVFAFFKQPEIAVGLSILLLGLAAVIFFYFWLVRMLPLYWTLRRTKAELIRVPDAQAFAAEFQRIDEALRTRSVLRHGWDEFKETLIFRRSDRPEPIRNTSRPSDYLNISSAVHAGLNLPFFQAIPNYFVGFGLLFTFLGLVAALYFASEGVAAQSVTEAQEELGNLLHAATFKFLTSIAGLFSSLFLSITFKLFILGLQRRFEQICMLLEQRMVFVTPESIAFDQFSELEKQTLQLERFNTDFALEIAKSLEERLNTSLGAALSKAIEPLVRSVDGMAENFGEMNQDAMSKIVGEFKEGLQRSAGKEMEAIVDALGSIQETLRGTTAGINQSSQDFGIRLEATAERLESLISGAGRTLETSVAQSASRLEGLLNDTARRMEDSVRRVSEEVGGASQGASESLRRELGAAGEALTASVSLASRTLNEALAPVAQEIGKFEGTLRALDGRLSAQLEGFDASIDRIRGMLALVEQSAASLREAGAPMARTAESLNRSIEQISQTAAAITQTHDKLTELIGNLDESAEAMKGMWEDLRERLEGVDQSLGGVLTEMQDGIDAYRRSVAEFVKEVDGHLDQSLRHLSGGVEELKESIEQLDDTFGRVTANGAGVAGS